MRSSGKITAFNNGNLAELRTAIKVALATVEARYGVAFSLDGSIRYSPAEGNTKLTMRVLEPAPVAPPKAPGRFPAGSYLGLTNADIGKTVRFSNGEFRIVGYDDTERTKRVMLVRVSDGKAGFKAPARDITDLLGITQQDTSADSYPGDWEFKQGESFEVYEKRTDALLKAIPADKIISFPIADGRAMYYVDSIRPLRLRHIPYGDAYRVLPATLRGLRPADVERMIAADKGMRALFAKKGEAA
jgi:hypothetical protein